MVVTDSAAHARHFVENFLAEYTAACDDLNVDAVVAVLRRAHVVFAGEESQGPTRTRQIYEAAFANAPRARHLVSNIHVRALQDGRHQASCRYARWEVQDVAELAGLGEYHVTFDLTEDPGAAEPHPTIIAFSVNRSWLHSS